jgi:hypothetical protein
MSLPSVNARADPTCGRVGVRTSVDADVAEVPAESGLEEPPGVGRQRSPLPDGDRDGAFDRVGRDGGGVTAGACERPLAVRTAQRLSPPEPPPTSRAHPLDALPARRRSPTRRH